jgi:hypothetical protein
MEIFWIKNINLGRLHICVGRNDEIYKMKKKRASIHLTHLNGQVFFTARIKSRFMNIDWV